MSGRGGRARLASLLGNALLAAAAGLVLVIAVGPLFLPYRVFTVLSGSMEPTIPVGAEVLDWPARAGGVREGDVITFQPPGRPAGTYVTHRVVGIDRTAAVPQLHTRGDANGAEDPWTLPANQSRLRVVVSVPLLGYAVNALASPVGRLLLIAVVAAFAVLYAVDLLRRPS